MTEKNENGDVHVPSFEPTEEEVQSPSPYRPSVDHLRPPTLPP